MAGRPEYHSYDVSAEAEKLYRKWKEKRQRRSASGKAYAMILRQPLAPIEKLPAEILQRIFEYSSGMSLPKASWHLMKKLEGHPIYKSMLAFTSDAEIIGPRASSLARPGNLALAGLPSIKPIERVCLQIEIFSSKWLTPDLLKNLQQRFQIEICEVRWTMFSIQRRYGSFRVRRSLRALWRETEADEGHIYIPGRATAAHFDLDEEGVVRFTPDLSKNLIEKHSFPVCHQLSDGSCAQFPEKWFVGPWERQDEEMIRAFAKGRPYHNLLTECIEGCPSSFVAWVQLLAVLEQRLELFRTWFLSPWDEPEVRMALSAVVDHTADKFRQWLDLRGCLWTG